AFVESLFRTAKYRPEFPTSGFADLQAARAWASRFVHCYNHEHRHTGIRDVSPAQRQAGEARHIVADRHALDLQARTRNPARWTQTETAAAAEAASECTRTVRSHARGDNSLDARRRIRRIHAHGEP